MEKFGQLTIWMWVTIPDARNDSAFKDKRVILHRDGCITERDARSLFDKFKAANGALRAKADWTTGTSFD